jgi:hypothetical protein
MFAKIYFNKTRGLVVGTNKAGGLGQAGRSTRQMGRVDRCVPALTANTYFVVTNRTNIHNPKDSPLISPFNKMSMVRTFLMRCLWFIPFYEMSMVDTFLNEMSMVDTFLMRCLWFIPF